MNFFELLNNWRMPEPQVFGIFHLFFFAVMISTTILLVRNHRNASEKTMRRIVLISWTIIAVLEVLKQIIVSYQDGILSYSWWYFPFQFCETPLYVMPILTFTKNEKVKQACISFLSTYALFAGLAIMIYPVTVLSTSVVLSIRTLIQHGFQVSIGVYLYAWNRKNATVQTFLYGIVIFAISVLVAVLLNEVLGALILKKEMNMFFIAKNYESEILIVRLIKNYVPWTVFLFCYSFGFTTLAYGVYLFETKVYDFYVKRHSQAQDENELEVKN